MSQDKVNFRKDKIAKLASVASEKEMQRRLGIESATAAAGVVNGNKAHEESSTENDGYPPQRKMNHY